MEFVKLKKHSKDKSLGCNLSLKINFLAFLFIDSVSTFEVKRLQTNLEQKYKPLNKLNFITIMRKRY